MTQRNGERLNISPLNATFMFTSWLKETDT